MQVSGNAIIGRKRLDFFSQNKDFPGVNYQQIKDDWNYDELKSLQRTMSFVL